MPLNFLQLLQESWNFMRNQANFSLISLGLMVAFQLLFVLLQPDSAVTLSATPEQREQILLAHLPYSVLSALTNALIAIMMILNIKAINDGQYRHFFNPLPHALKVLLPVIVINILMILPFAFGLSFSGMFFMAGSLQLLGLPLFICGAYLSMKLYLSYYAYLLDEPQKSISESLKFAWQHSQGRMKTLVLFCMIALLLPFVLNSQFMHLPNEPIWMICSAVISAILNVYLAIFGFRFYQIYRVLPVK